MCSKCSLNLSLNLCTCSSLWLSISTSRAFCRVAGSFCGSAIGHCSKLSSCEEWKLYKKEVIRNLIVELPWPLTHCKWFFHLIHALWRRQHSLHSCNLVQHHLFKDVEAIINRPNMTERDRSIFLIPISRWHCYLLKSVHQSRDKFQLLSSYPRLFPSSMNLSYRHPGNPQLHSS